MFFRSFLLNSKIFFSQNILYLNFRFFCSEEFCEDGFAITTACQNLVEDGCALLITDYPGKPCQSICQTKPPDLVEDGCALLITDYPGKPCQTICQTKPPDLVEDGCALQYTYHRLSR